MSLCILLLTGIRQQKAPYFFCLYTVYIMTTVMTERTAVITTVGIVQIRVCKQNQTKAYIHDSVLCNTIFMHV